MTSSPRPARGSAHGHKAPLIHYAAIALALPLSLLALYVGAYYALVEADPFTYEILHGDEIAWYPVYPDFPWGDGVAFFAPIHGIDRRLRPAVWPQPH